MNATTPTPGSFDPALSALEQFETGNPYRLALLVAPAGAGKTRLLQRWLAVVRSANVSGKPNGQSIAWVDLTPEDNDPGRFWEDLSSALQVHSIDCGELKSLEDAVIDLINFLAGQSQALTLILDHYQVITASEVHAAVSLLLDYGPPQLLLVIASRCEPPLPIPRLRARRQLLEIDIAK